MSGPGFRQFFDEHFIVIPVTMPAPKRRGFRPGDRVRLDMPGDPNHGRIGTIEIGHPVILDKPWQAVRIDQTLTNISEHFLEHA